MIYEYFIILYKMTLITIDGNIGCGKSYILNYLHRNFKVPIDLEPVENWNSFLEKLYNSQKEIFKFQVRIWLDRCWIQENLEDINMLIERSPYFIKNTFIKMAYDDKLITDNEYEILMKLHKKTDYLWTSNYYIYLRSSPDHCYNRMKKRNRFCEKNISLDYLKKLHQYHEETLKKAIENKMNVKVINVDEVTTIEIANEIIELLTNKEF